MTKEEIEYYIKEKTKIFVSARYFRFAGYITAETDKSYIFATDQRFEALNKTALHKYSAIASVNKENKLLYEEALEYTRDLAEKTTLRITLFEKETKKSNLYNEYLGREVLFF